MTSLSTRSSHGSLQTTPVPTSTWRTAPPGQVRFIQLGHRCHGKPPAGWTKLNYVSTLVANLKTVSLYIPYCFAGKQFPCCLLLNSFTQSITAKGAKAQIPTIDVSWWDPISGRSNQALFKLRNPDNYLGGTTLWSTNIAIENGDL